MIQRVRFLIMDQVGEIPFGIGVDIINVNREIDVILDNLAIIILLISHNSMKRRNNDCHKTLVLTL